MPVCITGIQVVSGHKVFGFRFGIEGLVLVALFAGALCTSAAGAYEHHVSGSKLILHNAIASPYRQIRGSLTYKVWDQSGRRCRETLQYQP